MVDLRAAIRALRRSPAFTSGAVLTLAIALGLVTTAMGLLAGALSGPTAGPGRIVLYLTEAVGGDTARLRWPYPAVEILQSSATSYERLASYTASRLNARVGEEAIRLDVEFVSPDYFEIAGVAPALGRLPARRGNTSDVAFEAAISSAAWHRLFGASADALGREISITRQPITIVGVLPPGFRGLSDRADIWLPHRLAPQLSFRDYFTSTEYFHTVIAQLKPAVTLAQARSELSMVAAHIVAAVPPRDDRARARGADAVPIDEARRSAATVRARALAALGSLLVLLIAGVNIAMLVAARLGDRQREFAIRLAIGANWRRVFSAVSMEIALVMVAGFGVAALAALWTRDLIGAVLPQATATPANDYGQLASFAGMRFDPAVAAAVAVVSLLAAVAIALPGCRRLLGEELTELLKRTATAGSRVPGRSLRVLVAVQIAASLALITSAGLVFRTIWMLSHVDPGFDATNVVAFSVSEDLAVQQPDSGPRLVERLLAVVGATRGVRAVTVDQAAPFSPRGARLAFVVEGRTEVAAPPVVGWHRVGPDHFAALGIPILRGRGFTANDRRGRPPVVVVNEAVARRFFPDEDPIGRRIRLPDALPGESAVAQIVGIVGNVTYWPPEEDPGPDVYEPALQFSYPFTTLMVRAAGNPAEVIAAVRHSVRQADPNLPLFDIVTLDDLAAAGRADRHVLLALLGLSAALGVLLSAVGVFALTAATFEGRRQELGVRVALGADPRRIARLVLRGTLTQAVLGTAVGMALALLAGGALSATLYGIAPHDPATLGAAGIAMLTVSVVAAYLPARRAHRLDPVRDMNSE